MGIEINKENNTINVILSNNTELEGKENKSFLFKFLDQGKDIHLIQSILGCYLNDFNNDIRCFFNELANHHNFF